VIAVVHLVWGPLGPAPLRRFMASYRRYAAGAEHELVALLNGVTAAQRPRLLAELDGIAHRALTLEEPVQDLDAYRRAAARLEHERVCFLNSYSEILAEDWLAKLAHALAQPGAGLVGASGSWASLHSAVLNAFLLPNPYRAAVPKRSVAREAMRAIEQELQAARSSAEVVPTELPPRTVRSSILSTLKALHPMPEQLLRFEPFPAYHVRTNAFMLDRVTFLGLKARRIARKMDAYLQESGRESITRQLQRQGLRTLVVARDGSFYDHEQWPASRTLWQSDQENLLVADNQTRSYANGDAQRRKVLSAFAWGPRADPRPPAVRAGPPTTPSDRIGAENARRPAGHGR
jgi:hypothetical protein